jgi:hypothetical protein
MHQCRGIGQSQGVVWSASQHEGEAAFLSLTGNDEKYDHERGRNEQSAPSELQRNHGERHD